MEFPFVRWRWLLPVLAAWIASTAWLVVRFRMLDSDSILYGLPLAFSRGPFSLHIPLIGDFSPYSESWGHHWPAALWLRGALFAVVPFDRWLDIALLLSCQFASALMAARLVWRLAASRIAAVACFAIIASDRVLIAGLQLHRFEAITILALVGLLAALVETSGPDQNGARSGPDPNAGCRVGRVGQSGSRLSSAETADATGIHSTPCGPGPGNRWLIAGFAGGFFAASTHPFGMLIGAGLVGLGVADALLFRRRTGRAAAAPAVGFVAGLAAVGAYYLLRAGAWEQFHENMLLQDSFNTGRGAFLFHLRYYHRLGHGLWGAAFLAMPMLAALLWRDARSEARFARWALPLSVLALPLAMAITRSANNSYLVLGTPFAALSLCCGFGLAASHFRPSLPRGLLLAVPALLALGFLTVYPYRWLVWFRAGCPDFPKAVQSVLDRLPPHVRVYIPPPMWDAARKDTTRDYRLWTFSVAAPWERRLAYERGVYAEAKPGDVLIVDEFAGLTGDPWGILPTFETRPPDPAVWERLFEEAAHYPGAGNDFGYDLVAYRFKGGAWDPGQSPRSMKGR